MLAGKGVNGAGKLANRTGMLPYPLTNFEVQNMKTSQDLMVFIHVIICLIN